MAEHCSLTDRQRERERERGREIRERARLGAAETAAAFAVPLY
jgi:hypothetical protein